MDNLRKKLQGEGLLNAGAFTKKYHSKYLPQVKLSVKGMNESLYIGMPLGYATFLFAIFGSYTGLDAWYTLIGGVGIGLMGASRYLYHYYDKKSDKLLDSLDEK